MGKGPDSQRYAGPGKHSSASSGWGMTAASASQGIIARQLEKDSRYSHFTGQLDEVSRDKLAVLLREYERRLEAELAELSLHYEKSLARETVRALERAVGSPDATDAAMELLTQEKLELSRLEQEYALQRQELQGVEATLQELRGENTGIMRHHKSLKQQLEDESARYSHLLVTHAAEVQELRDQLTDIEFYVRWGCLSVFCRYGRVCLCMYCVAPRSGWRLPP